MSSGPAIVFATFRPHPDKVEALRQSLDTMIENSRSEPGCQTYDLYRSGDDGSPVFHLFERYADADALEAHRASEHYKRYRAGLPDLLAEPVEVVVLQEVDAAGSGG